MKLDNAVRPDPNSTPPGYIDTILLVGDYRRDYDSAYKYLFSSKYVVHQLLTRFVDDEVMTDIAVDDIEPFDKSFVTDEFLNRESDVIYRVRTRGERDIYIYVLIEFQSTVDKSIPIRMLHYILSLYDQFYRESTAGKLPAVFPILLYNGADRWTVPQNVRELIEPAIAERYIPSFEYYPVIERDIPDETLERVRGLLSAVMYLEKRRDERELRETIDKAIALLEEEHPEQLRMFGKWLTRMFRVSMSETQIDRIAELREVKSMLGNVIEQIESRSEKRGIEKGRRADAVRMLRKGFTIDEVVEVTELSRKEVVELAEAKASDDGDA